MRQILKYLSRLMLRRYKPRVVGVTGSVGKTSAIEAIYAVLSHCAKPDGKCLRVRASKGFIRHSDSAAPLAILGDFDDRDLKLFAARQLAPSERFRKIIFEWRMILLSLFKIFLGRDKNYPEALVLEYGARQPRNMKYLLGIARPEVGVITAIGEIPAHAEHWGSAEALIREKAKLIEYLPPGGFAVLNFDDENVLRMKEKTRARVITFGFREGADLRIVNFENRTEPGQPFGVAFKIGYGGSFVPVIISKVFGRAEAYAAAIAACVGLIFDLNLVEVSEALSRNYQSSPEAAALMAGIKDTTIIDGSANASPAAVEEALCILRDLPGQRKVAVLGDILELGKYAIEAHESIGKLAGEMADMLVTVGPRGKFIAEGALGAGLSKNKVLSYDTVAEAGKALQDLIKKGDLILIKASKELGLDKIVEEVKAAPIV